jgi:hypothetical protein
VPLIRFPDDLTNIGRPLLGTDRFLIEENYADLTQMRSWLLTTIGAADIAYASGTGGIVASNVQAALVWLSSNTAPISHVGAGGGAHALATGAAAGFMSSAHWTKLEGIDLADIPSVPASVAAVPDTLAQRDGSADIYARLFRSEYAVTNPTVNYIMTQVNPGGDNYIRPSTPAQLAAALDHGLLQNLNLDHHTQYLLVNGTRAMTGQLQMGSQRVVSMADPVSAQDAATKAYVDALINGFDPKANVRVASIGPISIAAPGASMDGVTFALNDRVLLKDQASAAENGLWQWNGAAVPMTRTTDADTSAKVTAGMYTFVSEGTANADSAWWLTTNDPIVLGTTPLAFTQFAGPATYTAGAGLTRTGYQFDIVAADTTMTINADSIQVNTTVVGNAITLERVVSQGTLDNDVTVPSGNPIVLRDVGSAFTPVTIASSSAAHANALFKWQQNAHNVSAHAQLTGGSFNGVVQTNDKALIFSEGTIGTGSFVLAPWATGVHGLRMNASGQTTLTSANAGTTLSVLHTANPSVGAHGSALYVYNQAASVSPNYNTSPAALFDSHSTSGEPALRVRYNDVQATYVDFWGDTIQFAGEGYVLTDNTATLDEDANNLYISGGHSTNLTSSGSGGNVFIGAGVGLEVSEGAEAAGIGLVARSDFYTDGFTTPPSGTIEMRVNNAVTIYPGDSTFVSFTGSQITLGDPSVGSDGALFITQSSVGPNLTGVGSGASFTVHAGTGVGTGINGGHLTLHSGSSGVGSGGGVVIGAATLGGSIPLPAARQLKLYSDLATIFRAHGSSDIPLNEAATYINLPTGINSIMHGIHLGAGRTLDNVLTVGSTVTGVDNDSTLTSAQRVILRATTDYAADVPLFQLTRTNTGAGTGINVAVAGTDAAIRVAHTGTGGSSFYTNHDSADAAVLNDVSSAFSVGLQVRDQADPGKNVLVFPSAVVATDADFTVGILPNAGGVGYTLSLAGGDSSFGNSNGGAVSINGGAPAGSGVVGGVAVSAHATPVTAVAGEINLKSILDTTFQARGSAAIDLNDGTNVNIPASMPSIIGGLTGLAGAQTLEAVLNSTTYVAKDNDVTLASANRVILRSSADYAADVPVFDIIRTNTGLGTGLNVAVAGTDDGIRVVHTGTTTGYGLHVRQGPTAAAVAAEVDGNSDLGISVFSNSSGIALELWPQGVRTTGSSLELRAAQGTSGFSTRVIGGSATNGSGGEVYLTGGAAGGTDQPGGSINIEGGQPTGTGVVGGITLSAHATPVAHVEGEINLKSLLDTTFQARGSTAIDLNETSYVNLPDGITSLVQGHNRFTEFHVAARAFPTRNKRKVLFAESDFLNGDNMEAGFFSYTASGGTFDASLTDSSVAPGRVGMVAVAHGGGVSGVSQVSTNQAVNFGGGIWYMRADVRIPTVPDVTNNFNFLAGFFNATASDGAYILFSRAGSTTHWLAVTEAAGTTTTVGSVALSAAAYHVLEVEVNAAANQARFWVDGTLIATHTTNIPTSTSADMNIMAGRVSRVAGADRSVYIDYACYSFDRTTAL